MPPRAGESTILTLFADIHYLITPPGQRPPHHRFEKASYFYLYHSASTHASARIEIANNPGTPYQDAFTGTLANASVAYNHGQPNLVSLTVMRRSSATPGDTDQIWQLKSYDLPQQAEYMYLLHSIDVYFYTAQDADNFVSKAREMGVGAMDVRGMSAQQQHQPQQQSQQQPSNARNSNTMSPVVQKLEQAAITPTYGSFSHHRRDSSSINQSPVAQPTPSNQLLPSQTQQQSFSPSPSSAAASASSFAPPPLAYNPAAPAAPEPIAHREKTPPPVDAGPTVTAPATQEYGQQGPGYPYGQQGYTQQYAQQQQPQRQQQQHIQGYSGPPSQQPVHQGPYQGSFPSPPPMQQPQHQLLPSAQQPHSFTPIPTPGFASPPPPPPPTGTGSPYHAPTPPSPPHPQSSMHTQPQPQRQNSLPFQEYAASPPPQQYQQQQYQHQPPVSPGYPQQQQQQQQQYYHQSPLHSPSFSPAPPPPTSPPALTHTASFGAPPPSQTPQQYPQNLQQPSQNAQQHPTPTQIHNQAYVPSTAELAPGQTYSTGVAGPGHNPGRFEARTERLEKGVGRFLKRLDKKF